MYTGCMTHVIGFEGYWRAQKEAKEAQEKAAALAATESAQGSYDPGLIELLGFGQKLKEMTNQVEGAIHTAELEEAHAKNEGRLPSRTVIRLREAAERYRASLLQTQNAGHLFDLAAADILLE